MSKILIKFVGIFFSGVSIVLLTLLLVFVIEKAVEKQILPLEIKILRLQSNLFDLRSDLLDVEINEVICGELEDEK